MASPHQPRVALVTGASRGIGRAIALGLASRGFDIVANDIERQAEQLATLIAEVEAMGRRAFAIFADVSVEAEVQAMAHEAISRAGHVDVIVNNAGILIISSVENLPEDVWDRTMDVNAKGTFLVVKAFLPHMTARRYGRIVNIASIGGKQGAPDQAHYSASKAAVMGFTRVLAQEVAEQGITANCICPGIIMTDMGRANLEKPEIAAGWTSKTAMNRIGTPEDVVGPVAFFASDDCAFVTGQTLNVDGGIVYD